MISGQKSRSAMRDGKAAWLRAVPSNVSTCFGMIYSRHYCKHQRLQSPEEISAAIQALERENEGLLGEIVGGGTS